MRETAETFVNNMKKTPFGCEVEMYGISRQSAAMLFAEYQQTERCECSYISSENDEWYAWDRNGRKWKFVKDSSILGEADQKCEMVTPILNYTDDIHDLMQMLRIFRHHGAKSCGSLKCGVHVHISGEGHTTATICNLVNLMAAHEGQLIKAVGIHETRLTRYCRTVDSDFLYRIRQKRPKTLSELEQCWYDGPVHTQHYSATRYHMLNLHSFFTGNHTVEFRLFQFDEKGNGRRGGLHAGQLRAMILLSLALDHEARIRKYIKPDPQQTENEAFALRTFLVRIGFVGDEFREPRRYFLRNASGNSAWRYKDCQ